MTRTATWVVVCLIAVSYLRAASGHMPRQVSDPDTAAIQQLVHKAILLLDRPPQSRIVVVDPDKMRVGSPEIRRKLRQQIGGFVIPGRNIVYVNVKGKYLIRALAGDVFALHVFATELAHELEHAEKQAGECPAYTRQQRLWRSYVDRKLVQSKEADAYSDFLIRMMATFC